MPLNKPAFSQYKQGSTFYTNLFQPSFSSSCAVSSHNHQTLLILMSKTSAANTSAALLISTHLSELFQKTYFLLTLMRILMSSRSFPFHLSKGSSSCRRLLEGFTSTCTTWKLTQTWLVFYILNTATTTVKQLIFFVHMPPISEFLMIVWTWQINFSLTFSAKLETYLRIF